MSVQDTARPRIVVALLPEPETVATCLDCALAAAQGFDASISAVHVGFNPRFAFVPPEEIAIQQLRELREGTVADRLARTRAAFDAWRADRPDAPVGWQSEEGDVEELVARETARADLVVMGNPVRLDGRDAFHATLFWSKRLLLVAPPDARTEPGSTLRPARAIGRHIVVGWKPGEQVERAVRAALPWLRRADKVTVVAVQKPGADYLSSARALFSELGIAVDCIELRRESGSVGLQLLASADRLGADSLLIGAYKHGALWEAILGGVTRDVLAAARLPVFMMC
ncbi:universal stress protein [Pleomorphomonas sp. JP5]|uniref:universal stress protein n=1 Tax=Pleomorphomonas sp. JP5 TaxID=2942998 RepID=UPI0020434D0F|nr:universal stress protein [Pleomorphomonas sp. JP5]MCM5557530.1 universal stress protein [Pleomorphomonas sp. JP5]